MALTGASLSPEEFAALAREAGLTLRPGAEAEMLAAYGRLEELARRVRSPRAIDAEPAHIFVPPRPEE